MLVMSAHLLFAAHPRSDQSLSMMHSHTSMCRDTWRPYYTLKRVNGTYDSTDE